MAFLSQDEIDALLDIADQGEVNSSISVRVDKNKGRFSTYSHIKPGFKRINTSEDKFFECYDEYLDKIGYIDSECDNERWINSEEYKPIGEIYSKIGALELQIHELRRKEEELSNIKTQQDTQVKQEFLEKFQELYPEYMV